MGKAALFLVVILLALGLFIGFWVVGQYNGLVAADEAVGTQWAQVETAYQRRADLIPNLVSTVRGAAEFEQDTLNQVIEARSRVGQVSAEIRAVMRSPGREDEKARLIGRLKADDSRRAVQLLVEWGDSISPQRRPQPDGGRTRRFMMARPKYRAGLRALAARHGERFSCNGRNS